MSEQEQKVETSLIDEFWLRVKSLTEHQAQYGYYLSMLTAKKDSFAEDNGLIMEDADNANLKTLLYNLHFNVNLTFISYSTIADSIKTEVELKKTEESKYKSLKEMKDTLQAQYIMDLQTLEDYIIILNRFIAQHITKNVLKSNIDKTIESYNAALNHESSNGEKKHGTTK